MIHRSFRTSPPARVQLTLNEVHLFEREGRLSQHGQQRASNSGSVECGFCSEVELGFIVDESERINWGWLELLVYEQVVIAALDCNRLEVADVCLKALIAEFPTSLRVRKLRALQLEAREKYDDAVELLDYIIKQDETNAAPRKRKVAILKAKGKISDAIKELTEYLKKFMSDQEGWQELSELYLQEQDFGRAAFCMEELILHNPHSHLIHQHYAEIKYTQASILHLA
uniref:ER membrane protein complex subunit 2 n=1 Tax=Timema cristinae TaxID=61476 RepID=A0A7R9CSD0_TIMCR|nr:unnamed protein product [Timema cristinae]